MSGAEAAGLALAVIPLLVKAASRYNDCLTPLRRYRKFGVEAEALLLQFNTQKAIFRAQCRLLLEFVVENGVAIEMLAGHAHETWADPALEEQLAAQLGEQYDAGIDIALMISKGLENVNEECQYLEKMLDCNDQAGIPLKAPRKLANRHANQNKQAKLCDKRWRCEMGKKLEFSFSKSSRLDKAVGDLRRYNHDFRTLVSQSAEEAKNEVKGLYGSKIRNSKEVEKYRVVGKAAQLVYEALRKACTKHTDHLAHFCVQVEDIIFGYGCSAQVKFSMAFTHITSSGSLHQGEPVWFVVDSTLDDTLVPLDEHSSVKFEELKQSLKRQVDSVPERTIKKPKKTVSFQTTVPVASSAPTSSTISPALSMGNLSGKDFCDFLRQSTTRPIAVYNTGLYTLESSPCCRHLIHPSAAGCSQLHRPISLGQLVSPRNGRRRMENFSPYERIRLARTLAVAVLQYHATPWLRKAWRSEDVYFFGLDDETKDVPVLTPPHVNPKVHSPNGQMPHATTFTTQEMARNTLLFSLGVFLIEIAFQISLHSLQRPSDLENGQVDRYTEFFVARRLGKARCTGMGPRYDKIIQRLVECDFGCGDDLTSLELQGAFHDTVISPLETLEKELHDLHLNHQV